MGIVRVVCVLYDVCGLIGNFLYTFGLKKKQGKATLVGRYVWKNSQRGVTKCCNYIGCVFFRAIFIRRCIFGMKNISAWALSRTLLFIRIIYLYFWRFITLDFCFFFSFILYFLLWKTVRRLDETVFFYLSALNRRKICTEDERQRERKREKKKHRSRASSFINHRYSCRLQVPTPLNAIKIIKIHPNRGKQKETLALWMFHKFQHQTHDEAEEGGWKKCEKSARRLYILKYNEKLMMHERSLQPK